MYIFHPPIFKGDYGTSFGESWEIFCQKILTLYYGTMEIEKREPPESGVDLFYKDKKIAFQCKGTIDESGKFNLTNAKKSLESALKIQNELGWEEYILCINGDITGAQKEKLEKVYKNIKVFSKPFWINICEKHPEKVQQHFRKIVDVPSEYVNNTIQRSIKIPPRVKELLKDKRSCFKVLFYSVRFDGFFQINIHPEMKISELLQMIYSLYGIPYTGSVQSEGSISIELIHEDEIFEDHTINVLETTIKQSSILMLKATVNTPILNLHELLLKESEDFTLEYMSEREDFLSNAVKSFVEKGY
ncbi:MULTISPECIES: hypothetical protein [unclassified Exiguobacterium]|uniref:hypothetical protein n=1 Tax=unclassified Exiguobacterium TaxID=2644629 RepID=UPI001BECB474|nr:MULTISPECIES: hypothetical protein [unclassified Exiguobacterium]